MSAREVTLQRIRTATGNSLAGEEAARAWHALPRRYNVASRGGHAAMLELLEDRLRDYDATVVRCPAAEVAGTLEQMLSGRKIRNVLIPAGLPRVWLAAGLPFVEDRPFTSMELDRFDAVLTGASLAVAETGTIVLQNVPGQGRRAISLVPDYHLCVVHAADVVETVPEAMARLAATQALATTFISGPSATADIEMTRIKGVHGPRTLDVLLVI